MFFKNKVYEELQNKLENVFQIFTNKFDGLEQSITTENSNLEDINKKIDTLTSAVNKHGMAIEDLLDEWEEKSSSEDSTKKLLQESIQSEQQLLELFEVYQEQFWNLKHFAEKEGEVWKDQVTLMEKKQKCGQQLCGLNLIDDCGVEVDYNLHEVIQVVDTTDLNNDKMIAEIYHCGYIYKGKVRKKAVVSAYRYNNNTDTTTH